MGNAQLEHVNVARSFPSCVEGERFGASFLNGREGVDWIWSCQSHRSGIIHDGMMTPVMGKKLVLKCDHSSIHCDLKSGFEFDRLEISTSAEDYLGGTLITLVRVKHENAQEDYRMVMS